MSKKRTFFLLSVMLMLTLAAGMSLAQGPQPPVGQSGSDAASPQASVSSGFTYQGWLTDGSGSPIDDTCSLDFTMWEAENGGSVVGHQLVTGVEVIDGYLAVLLNSGDEFGEDAFTGEARWLKIGVKCSADADWSFLSGRQLLSATPYALSLRPGARIVGEQAGSPILHVQNDSADSSTGIRGYTSATTGFSPGVTGQSASTDGRGVLGLATASTGTTYGVYGQSASTDGRGVLGDATATSGTTTGVYGQSRSADGYGGYFGNIAGGTALYAAGDVAQDAGAAGLVKAAVYVECKGVASPPPHRFFNTVSGNVTSHDVGYLPVSGTCVLDFGFDLSARFWIAMAYSNSGATTVSCTLNSLSNYQLVCTRRDKDGNYETGDIMVLVY